MKNQFHLPKPSEESSLLLPNFNLQLIISVLHFLTLTYLPQPDNVLRSGIFIFLGEESHMLHKESNGSFSLPHGSDPYKKEII